MNDAKSGAFVFLLTMVPYLLVAWGYTGLTGGDGKTFWTALGVLFAARLFFSVIETIGSVLVWRFYSSRNTVNRAVEFLRVNSFPMREYRDDNLSNYLARIEDGYEYPQSLKARVKELEQLLEIVEEMSILGGARMHSAWNTALDIYAPRHNATKIWTPLGSS